MATATKSRRQSKAQPEAEKNPIVARRLAFIPRADLRKAAKEFSEGKSLSELVEKYGFKRTAHATYGIRQELVEQGAVSRIDPTDAAAIKRASQEDEYSDLPWLAARTGLNGDKVKDLIS